MTLIMYINAVENGSWVITATRGALQLYQAVICLKLAEIQVNIFLSLTQPAQQTRISRGCSEGGESGAHPG